MYEENNFILVLMVSLLDQFILQLVIIDFISYFILSLLFHLLLLYVYISKHITIP